MAHGNRNQRWNIKIGEIGKQQISRDFREKNLAKFMLGAYGILRRRCGRDLPDS